MVGLGGMWFPNHHRHHDDDNDQNLHQQQQDHQQHDDEDTALCYTDIEQQQQQRLLVPEETNEYDNLKSLLLNNHNIYHEEQSCNNNNNNNTPHQVKQSISIINESTTPMKNNNNDNNYDSYQYNTLSMNNHSPRRSSNSLFADEHNDVDNVNNNNNGIQKSFSSIGFGIDYYNNTNNNNEKDILFNNNHSHIDTSKYYGSFRRRNMKNQNNDTSHSNNNDDKTGYDTTTTTQQQQVDNDDNDSNNIPNVTRNLDNEIDYVVLRWCAVYGIIYIVIGVIAFSYIFEQWTIIDSIYFAVTTFTTVGYGDLQPSTSIGQLFTIVYALYGVLILGIFIGIIGHAIGTNQYNTIEQLKQKQLKTFLYDLFYSTTSTTTTTTSNTTAPSTSSYQCYHPQQQQQATTNRQQQHEQKSTTVTTVQSIEENNNNNKAFITINGKKQWNNHKDDEVINEQATSIMDTITSFIHDHTILLRIIIQNLRSHLLEIIIIGTLAFILGIRENWTITSTLYFAVMSASTTGYGDYTPHTQIDKLYCIFFLPLSVAIFGELLGSIATTYIQKRQNYIVTKLMNESLLNQCDLRNMDSDRNGNVDIHEFTCFMLVALQKCDQETINELHFIFHSFDKDGNGLLEKNDLVQVTRRSGCLSSSPQQQHEQIITTSDELLLDAIV